MEETKYLVMQKTNEFPTALKGADDVAASIGDIGPERIVELAEAGYLPHYRIDGGPPKFKIAEVKQWLASNLVSRSNGRSLPDAIRIVVAAEKITDRPPSSICNIPNMQQMPRHGYQPGVYFLCKGDDVVYVGQSVSPSSRIAGHCSDRTKDFDRVYLLPVPQSELDNAEAAFIHHLMPVQQGGLKSGKGKPTSPRMSKPKDEILMSFGHCA